MDKFFARRLNKYRRRSFSEVALVTAAVALSVAYDALHPSAALERVTTRLQRKQ